MNVEARSAPTQAASPRTGAVPFIYLVDDEPLLLELAEMILEGDGYRIAKFQNPGEALACFRSASPAPDLLITDYAMLGMNGLELIEACRRLCPTLRVILISGSVDSDILSEATVEIDHFMRKPYRTVELGEVVRTLLAG